MLQKVCRYITLIVVFVSICFHLETEATSMGLYFSALSLLLLLAAEVVCDIWNVKF
jgi:hypothetical protein